MEIELFGFETLGKGAGKEKFDEELDKVLKNIQDTNTNWKDRREITLKVTVIPSSDERREAKVVIEASSKLAKPKPFVSTLVLGALDGKDVGREIVQGELFPQQEKKDGKVLNMAAGAATPQKEGDDD